MTDAPSLPPSTHVGRVALTVTDLDAAVDFYERVVGLTVTASDEDGATLGAGDEPLLELRADQTAPERGRDEAGLFHTAYRVPTREALGDALERITDRWRLSGASDHLVSEALYLADPEGNGVEIYCDRPREAWEVTPDGHVTMDTRPLALDDLRTAAAGEVDVPGDTDVGHVHLEVTDLADARAFYVDTLGLRVRQTWNDSALFVAAGDYHHHVGLNTWNGRTAPSSGRGLDWFELVVPDESSLAAVRERLVDAGHQVEPVREGFTVTDPDGITVRVRH